jgi:hypothetical protein
MERSGRKTPKSSSVRLEFEEISKAECSIGQAMSFLKCGGKGLSSFHEALELVNTSRWVKEVGIVAISELNDDGASSPSKDS